jgi:cyclopropane-fatty-acyl-phospholipid synthase
LAVPGQWDIRVHRDRFYRRMLAGGSLALGESYMDGDWDCDALDQFFDRVISHRLGATLGMTLPLALLIMVSRLQNRQTVSRAKQAADVHYDLPVDIFEATFDKRVDGKLRLLGKRHDAGRCPGSQARSCLPQDRS